jgi:hypothetical protein
MTVIVWGVPTESPVSLVLAALARRGADAVVAHPRRFASQWVELESCGGEVAGRIRLDDVELDPADVSGVYVRLVEPQLLPEYARMDDASRSRAQGVFEGLLRFCEVAGPVFGCRVANPVSAMASNMSKPYQSQLISRAGFDIPTTLLTDDPEEALAFLADHPRAIFKSASGVRSIVREFDLATDRQRLDRIRWCPVQFQENVVGRDVRVHVVGQECHAAIVDSEATDYRYARSQVGEDARLAPFALPDELAERCVALSTQLGLPFAGVDLKLADDGRVVCFEVNPSPGFPWYEAAGLPISDSLARWLDPPEAGRELPIRSRARAGVA